MSEPGDGARTHLVAKVAVFDEQNNVLLIRRSKTAPRRALQWDFPGGMVEAGERFNEAAAREAMEEAGISLDPHDLCMAWTTTKMVHGISVSWFMFIARTSNIDVKLSFEHDTYTWLSIEEAIKTMEYPLQKEVLRYVLDNKLMELI